MVALQARSGQQVEYRRSWLNQISKGADMSQPTRTLQRFAVILFIAVSLFTASACNSGSSAKTSSGPGPDIDTASAVMCIGDHISSPTYAFHYSYKYSDATGSVRNDEADITPQEMDITVLDKSGSHKYHGARSDEGSWNSALVDLGHLGFTAMTGRLAPLKGSSALVQQGSETINGYSTAKYLIDTDNANAADKQTFAALLGNGSFEKGTVWVAADGCAAKLLLDEGVWHDGSIIKDHFEIARVKH
jgi:hypothetical protein